MVRVSDLGPQWSDSFGPEPVVAKATMDVNSGRTPKQANVWRGETRKIYPTPEYPDPAKASREDPAGLIEHWTSGSHPYPADSGYGTYRTNDKGESVFGPVNEVTSGVHWTESPQSIPERFTESTFKARQHGTKMSANEARMIKEDERIDALTFGPDRKSWRDEWTPEETALETKVERRKNQGKQPFRDLGHRAEMGGGSTEPYNMGVIWHGKIDARHIDHSNPTTDFEDEVNLRMDSNAPPVPVHAMQINVPESGSQGFPEAGVTHDIVRRAGKSGADADPYQAVLPHSLVPWSTVQFPPGQEKQIPIRDGRRSNL